MSVVGQENESEKKPLYLFYPLKLSVTFLTCCISEAVFMAAPYRLVVRSTCCVKT